MPRLPTVLVLIATAGAEAQVGGSRLEGTVFDPSGAVVPGVLVTSLNERTGLSAATTTSHEGFFVFQSAAAGLYRLTVEAPGFRRQVVTGVEVRIATDTTLRVNLELGNTAENLTIEAEQTAVQVSNAQGGGVIDQRDIEVLPQVERNPVRLVVFQAGVQVSPGTIGLSRVNGARHSSQVVRVDGVDVTSPISPGLGFAAVPPSDTIQEFRVLTHSAKAEYGRVGGAQVEMASRSGSNRWSGTLFHFHRDTALNANDFFNNSAGVARPKFIYNNFGGSLGGPLRRNRTFLFTSYSGLRTSQDVSRNRLVLTPEAKAGLFRWRSPGGVVQAFDIAGNDPRGRGIDPQIAAALRLLPEPNNSEHAMADGLNSGGFRFNNPANSRMNIISGRADETVREDLRLFLRINSFFDTSTTDVINNADATFPGQAHGVIFPFVRGFSAGLNWTISPRAINDLRVGQHRVYLDLVRPARLAAPMLAATAWTNPLSPLFGSEQRGTVNSVSDSMSLVAGSHTLRTGFEWRYLRLALLNASGTYPNVFLGSDSGNSVPANVGPQPGIISSADRQRFDELYNHLLGRISRVEQTFYSDLRQFLGSGVARRRNFRNHEIHAFFQDDWKLHRNLMLNLGLRWEMHGAPYERDGLQGTFDRVSDLSNASQISDLTVTRTGSWYARDWNNFAPRAALVWDPKGDARTALRVSYGIYYDAAFNNVIVFADERTPGFSQVSPVLPNAASDSDVRLSDNIPLPPRPATPLLQLPNQRLGLASVFSPHLRTAYLQQYSISLQQEMAHKVLVEAAYVGNRGIKLFMQTMPNQRKIEGDFLAAFRELQTFRSDGISPPGENTLVRLFGSAEAAVTAIGATNLNLANVGLAADNVDRIAYPRYLAAGLSDFYIRNFPQYNMLFLGANDGRSYYDSLQVSLRKRAGRGRLDIHYTWSKALDILSNLGASQESVIDNFNLRLNRARSDLDRSHVLSGSAVWTAPIGKQRRAGGGWLRSAVGGWDFGVLAIWQSGAPFTVRSGRQTAGAPVATFANFTGDRKIGRVERRGDGVYFFTEQQIRQFSFPDAGQIGTAGRNTFRGPRFFNVDLSLSKRFRFTERQTLSARAEAYNVFNNPNFANPGASLVNPNGFGKIGSGLLGLPGSPMSETFGGPRVLQVAIRWEFQ